MLPAAICFQRVATGKRDVADVTLAFIASAIVGGPTRDGCSVLNSGQSQGARG